jgi:hypothetical protein
VRKTKKQPLGVQLLVAAAFVVAVAIRFCGNRARDAALPAEAVDLRSALVTTVSQPAYPALGVGAADRSNEDAGTAHLTEWDPREYQRLAAPERDSTDSLTRLPEGEIVVPPAPLSIEELLEANRPEQTITYRMPGTGEDATRLPLTGALPDGQISIESGQYLDYDEEHHMIYSQHRATVRFGAYTLEADKLLIDTRLPQE